jgi:Transposase DDE domain
MSGEECTERSEKLQDLLEITSQEAGRESGFVKRASKLTAAIFVKSMVLGLLEKGDASLLDFVEVSSQLGVTISESGFAQRMNEGAVRLLRTMVQAGIEQLGELLTHDTDLFKGFSAVTIIDGTQVKLPESCADWFRGNGKTTSAASAKIQVGYEYLSGTFSALVVGNGRDPDQNCRLPVTLAKPGSLALFDLGYFKQTALAAIDAAKAFFVTRLQTQTALYWQAADQQPADVITHIEQQQQDCGEVTAYLGAKARLRVRIVYRRLPAHQVAKKRRHAQRLAKKNKRTCSPRHLQFLAWQVCITNVPISRWSANQVLLVYRLRWQIELVFKLWKSHAQLTTVRCERPERVACLLYAHLLGMLLFYWLIAPARADSLLTELSPVKAFNLLQKAMPTLIRRIAAGWQTVANRLARFYSDLARFAQKSSRPQMPSTRQRLLSEGI